ncbi:urate hydroxylase PuuD [Peredibacter starrii]|uniref:Urate hydroxylase PuuD n=1 Tax=Peredibacter starrii TaxID=28202 RepID=A0AAX4HM39_9BACT|nr:urate hydroxylase PuuD [Peredibacter starrii]WPU64281.1 urate hydroxylase PuuD [Peredibacter starrii]
MDVGLFTQDGLVMVLRWIHFFAGVAWIGHLYYFNFVQGAFMPEVDATVKNNVFAKLVPRAMWWFRWGAMFTFLSGLIMLLIAGKDLGGDFMKTPYGIFIWTGALMGTFMFLNVWLIIWPIQRGLINNGAAALSGGTPDASFAAKAPKALLASRTNTMFSIPLLFFMGAARHLPLTIPEDFNPGMVLALVTLIILGLEVNAIKGKLGPMTTVKGVIHCGVALLVVLYALIEVLV